MGITLVNALTTMAWVVELGIILILQAILGGTLYQENI
jgi:hypothetical protein